MRKTVNLEEARRRRQAKIRQKKQRQTLALILALGALILIVVALVAVINSSFWTIKTVQIQGQKRVSRAEILKIVNLKKDQNLLKLPVSLIKAKLSKHPYIKDVTINRLLPNKVLIQIKERTPFANVKQGAAYFVVDKHGYALEKKAQARAGLPVITDLNLKIEVGKKTASPQLAQILKVISNLTAELRSKIAWVSLPAAKRITFHTAENLEIVYGDASEYKKKNFALSQILKESGKGKIIYINVAIPKIPIVKRIKQ